MTVVVKRLADHADSTIHHVGRSDNVAARIGLHNGLPGEHLKACIVCHFAVSDDSVLSMSRVRIQCDISDQANIDSCAANGLHGRADQVIRV